MTEVPWLFFPEPSVGLPGGMDEKQRVRPLQEKGFDGLSGDILLDHLDGAFIHPRDDGQVSVLGVGKDQDVMDFGTPITTVSILKQASPWVQLTLFKACVKEIFCVALGMRHPVVHDFCVESLDEFHALPFLAVIIIVCTPEVAAMTPVLVDTVFVNGNIAVTVSFATDRLQFRDRFVHLSMHFF